MLYCETGEFAAVCAGKAKMKQIDSDVLTLAEKLMAKVKAIRESGEITLKVTAGWVTAVGVYFMENNSKHSKTVD